MEQFSEQNFTKLVRGKNCVVVAPSGFMNQRGHGDFIDSFDFVVKCNISYLNFNNSKDLGKRCDLWYGRPLTKHHSLNYKLFKKCNSKLMCLLPKTRYGWENWENDHLEFVRGNANYNFKFRVIDREKFIKLEEILNSVPTTGIVAIHDLLEAGAKKVYAIGFDFHQSGYAYQQSVDLKETFSGRHDIYQCKRYIWNLLQDESRFQCDKHLSNILEKVFANKNNKSNNFKIEENLYSEINHFFKNKGNDRILLFRSCNIEAFKIMHKCISKSWKESDIMLLIQKSFSNYYQFQKSNLITYDSDGEFDPSLIKEKLSLINSKGIDICFIPYNGQTLLKYINVFNIIKLFKVKKIFIISIDGFIKELPNLNIILKEIRYYEERKNMFLKLRDQYDTEDII